jgi:hypothetical protein
MNQGAPEERRGGLCPEYYVKLTIWWAKLQYSCYVNYAN